MTREEAISTLDETGMLRAMGIASDTAGEPMRSDRPFTVTTVGENYSHPSR